MNYKSKYLLGFCIFFMLMQKTVAAQDIVQQLYDQGYEEFSEGRYFDAIESCTRAINRNSKFTDAYLLRASAYLSENYTGDAIYDYSTAISIFKGNDKDLSIIYANRGYAYFSAYQVKDAIRDYTVALDLDPDNAQAVWDRGIAYQDQGIYDTAISDYSVAAQYYQKDNNSLSIIYTNRGQCFLNLKKYNQALADCNTALLLNPENGSAYWLRGIVYESKSETEKAIKDLTYALFFYQNSPNEMAILFWKTGTDYYSIGNYKSARRFYNRAILVNPSYIQAYYYRGLLFLNQFKKANKANKDFKKLTVLDTGATYYKAVGKYLLGDDKLAIYYLNNFPNKFSSTTEMNLAYFDAACLYSLMNNQKEALTYLEKALYSGYNDFVSLKTDPSLENIRQTEDYKGLVKKYGAN